MEAGAGARTLEMESDMGALPDGLRRAEPFGSQPIPMWAEFLRRARTRFLRYSLGEMIAGWIFSRKLTRHGLTIVSDGRPWPKVINRGGEIHTENCQFYSGVRLEVGPGAKLEIGNGTYLNRNTQVHARTHVRIGADCQVSWDVVIMDSDLHSIPGKESEMPVFIEDNVWIGCRVIILKGVRVGRGAVIAAGSVVTKDVPPDTVFGGVPARFLFDKSRYEDPMRAHRTTVGSRVHGEADLVEA
jgi:acetyltransferase-like isoleucine patch superfamily enzyme